MTQKENKEIAISISTFLSQALKEDAIAEDVANSAISFCTDLMKNFPEVKNTTSEIMNSLEWDEMIAWVRYEKANLS